MSEEKPTVTIRVPEKKSKLFKPYMNLKVGRIVTIEVKGKVTGIRMDQYGNSLDMELSLTQEDVGSIANDMKEAKEMRKV